MKAQNRFPFDSTVVGLNGTYNTIGNNSFFVNSGCILATEKIITTGKEYIIFKSPSETGIKIIDVTLVDCYYRGGYINLIVQDLRPQRTLTHHWLECPGNDCKWVFIDLDYFIVLLNAKAVKDYCADCIDNLKQHIAEINSNVSGDDLLEFEF